MNRGIRTSHLSDAEFGRLLDGAEPGTAAAAHLSTCEFCRQELEAVQVSLGSFRALSTVWAEAEAPGRIALPSRLAANWTSPWAAHAGAPPSWTTGLAVTAMTGLLAFGLGFPGQNAHFAPAPSAVAPSNAELAVDNQLMVSIDQELSDPGQPAVSPTELRGDGRQGVLRSSDTVTD